MNNWILPIWMLLLVCTVSCDTSNETDLPLIKELEASFADPPASAKPWTWWHWIDGNVTKKGITSDLEAMERAGLGAALIFNVKLGFPDGPARFMSEGWLELLDHAAAECDRLGLKLGIHNCDGWSQAGHYSVYGSYDDTCDGIHWGIADTKGTDVVRNKYPGDEPYLYCNVVKEILKK